MSVGLLLVWCVVFALALGLGFYAGSRGGKTHSTPDLQLLEERLQHARNLSMRLGEMAEHEKHVSAASSQLEDHVQLKEGVAWILLQAQHLMHTCRPEQDPRAMDRMEAVLSSTSKSLRHLIEVGRQPVMPWLEFIPATEQLHHTLCLILEINPSKESDLIDFQNSDLQVYTTPVLNQLIALAMRQSLPARCPFKPTAEGLVVLATDGTQAWSQPWEVEAL